MEKSMTSSSLQKVGLLDDCVEGIQPEFVYCLIAMDEHGQEYVEGVFLNEERANLRKAVLAAEEALREAKWRESNGICTCGDKDCTYLMDYEQTVWFVRTARLHR
jgi:hypothetical protein